MSRFNAGLKIAMGRAKQRKVSVTLWQPPAKSFEVKPMTPEDEKQIGGLISNDGEIWWLPKKN